MRIVFRPNPAFTPSSYDERVVHGLGGTILIRMPAERLCSIEGRLLDRVSFGYGLLGHIDKDSHFHVVRAPVTETDWKNAQIDVHVDGKVLVSRASRATSRRPTPAPCRCLRNLSLAEAACPYSPGGPMKGSR